MADEALLHTITQLQARLDRIELGRALQYSCLCCRMKGRQAKNSHREIFLNTRTILGNRSMNGQRPSTYYVHKT